MVLEQILETLIICSDCISYHFPYGKNFQLNVGKIHMTPPIKIQIDPSKYLHSIYQYPISKDALQGLKTIIQD